MSIINKADAAARVLHASFAQDAAGQAKHWEIEIDTQHRTIECFRQGKRASPDRTSDVDDGFGLCRRQASQVESAIHDS